MKKIAIAIIILAVIGGGFYLGDNFANSNNNSNVSTSVNSNSNSQMQNTNNTSDNNNNSSTNTKQSSQNNTANQNSSVNSTQNSASSITRVSSNSSNNTNNVENQSNSSSPSNQNQGITVSQIPQGYGNFDALIQSASTRMANAKNNTPMFLQLNILNSQLYINLNDVQHLGKLIVLKGHYITKPFEQFTYYVSNTCNKPIDGPHKKPEYTMYEFYNGVNTGIIKVNFQGAAVYGGFVGTFEHVNPKETYPCQGPVIQLGPSGLGGLPYYNGSVAGTNVTLATTSAQQFFDEKYANDNNIFTVGVVPMPSQFKDKNYKYALEENFDGNTTGIYLLNMNPDTKNLNGIYIPFKNGSFSINNESLAEFAPSPLPQVN